MPFPQAQPECSLPEVDDEVSYDNFVVLAVVKEIMVTQVFEVQTSLTCALPVAVTSVAEIAFVSAFSAVCLNDTINLHQAYPITNQ